MSLLAALVVAMLAGVAQAYPQFQLSTGADRCITCHVSPAGGGLINDYGRDEAGSSISGGGDGRFLHGAWTPPAWLQLGVDLRGAAAFKRDRGSSEWLAFPMQADVYVRAGSEAISFNMTVGLRGGARDPQPPLAERLASREHYAMYQHASGAYARVGRFFPVFGVRTQDHTAYVRRYLGFHTLEEPYGASGGMFGDDWEAHVGAFVPRPIEFLGSGSRASGANAYYERRLDDGNAAIAGQARLAVAESEARVAAGVVGKRWFQGAGVMLLAELDLQRQSFDVGPTRYQLAGYASASKFVMPGVMVGGGVHHWQPDLRLRSTRDAVQLDVQYFPIAHVELHLLTRLSAAAELDEPSLLTFLQLHYYL